MKGNFQGPFRNRELNMMDSRMNKGPVNCRGAFFNGVVEYEDFPISPRVLRTQARYPKFCHAMYTLLPAHPQCVGFGHSDQNVEDGSPC